MAENRESRGALPLEGTLLIVGGGRMGGAIAGGLVRTGAMTPDRIVIAEPDADKGRAMAEEFGVRTVTDAAEALADTAVVLLAVKPQVIESVVASLAHATVDALVVSIAAGISCARLESWLPTGTAVVRVMPNATALVGAGMALVSGGSEASADQVELVRDLFGRIGESVVIDERMQDIGTAISGSGPAYFALVIDALARAGVEHGLARDVSQRLAVQTMLGTARMIAETGIHPEELVDAVSSPGGTTIAGIAALERGGARSAFSEAVSAAVRRSRELGS